MLKKENVLFEFHQEGSVKTLEGECLDFRIYLKTLDGANVYEIEFYEDLGGNVQLNTVCDLDKIVDTIVMKNKATDTVVKYFVIGSYPSYAIIASDTNTIKESLCFTAQNII